MKRNSCGAWGERSHEKRTFYLALPLVMCSYHRKCFSLQHFSYREKMPPVLLLSQFNVPRSWETEARTLSPSLGCCLHLKCLPLLLPASNLPNFRALEPSPPGSPLLQQPFLHISSCSALFHHDALEEPELGFNHVPPIASSDFQLCLLQKERA